MRCIYSHGGINWTWYADIELHDDDSATVHREWRSHNERDSHPDDSLVVGHYSINEIPAHASVSRLQVSQRMAIGVILTVTETKLYPLRGGPVERWSFPGENA